jgi:hypothetical protein
MSTLAYCKRHVVIRMAKRWRVENSRNRAHHWAARS